MGSPCGGRPSTLPQLTSASPFKVLTPHDPMANDANLSNVWDCPGEAVQLDFSSGISVFLEINTLAHREADWAAMAAQDPDDTSVGIVRGEAAEVIDAEKDVSQTADGGVVLVENGVFIAVTGNGNIPLDNLRSVAESLR